MANFTLALPPDAEKKLEWMKEKSHLTKAELFRRALALYAVFLEESDTSDLMLVDKQSKEQKIKLII